MSLPTSRDKIVHARLKVRRRRAPLPGADIDECDATREPTLLPTLFFLRRRRSPSSLRTSVHIDSIRSKVALMLCVKGYGGWRVKIKVCWDFCEVQEPFEVTLHKHNGLKPF